MRHHVTTEPHHVAAIRSVMATAMLAPPAPQQLGDIRLLPHQRDAVAQLTHIMAQHGGALLADEVGMGKTYVALAVARQYASVHVIAPAALLPMWRTACTHAALHRVHCTSLHAWSAASPPVLHTHGPALVVIDEAHHLRNPGTRRYQHISEALAGCDVLLLSATPVHNRPQDLHAMLALFRGNRPDNLTPQQLARLIVRRRHIDVARTPGHGSTAHHAGIPQIQQHRPFTVSQDRETLSLLLALPAPLPAHDGAVAGALIRLGLLRAWCSSDAALTVALTRRRLRGEALCDALRAGRHPTRDELQTWVVGDDAGQLAFPELMAEQRVESGPLLEVLQRHLDAIAMLARHHANRATGDVERAAQLRDLCAKHPNTPIVAFSQYTHTITALFRALSDIAGVAAATGKSARIASGPLPREELLALFAPRAAGRPPPEHLRVRLLLTTDLLAEGVNLQEAGIVVHLDLPWTHALRQQRVGRVARLGSPHPAVHVYRLRPPPAVRKALRAEARLLTKRQWATRLVGSDGMQIVEHSAADWQATLYRYLRRWIAVAPNDVHDVHTGHSLAPSAPLAHVMAARVMLTHGTRPMALALMQTRGGPDRAQLLAVVPRSRRHISDQATGRSSWRWHVTTNTRIACQVVRHLDRHLARSGGVATKPNAHDAATARGAEASMNDWVRALRRAIARWQRRHDLRATFGPTRRELPPVALQLLQRLDQCVREWSVTERARYHTARQHARALLLHATGAAADRAMQRWLRNFPMEATAAARASWVDAWRQEPALAEHRMAAPLSADGASSSADCRTEMRAMLVGWPAAPSAPSAPSADRASGYCST